MQVSKIKINPLVLLTHAHCLTYETFTFLKSLFHVWGGEQCILAVSFGEKGYNSYSKTFYVAQPPTPINETPQNQTLPYNTMPRASVPQCEGVITHNSTSG